MEKRFNRLGMFRLIADKIEEDPSRLEIGLENIEQWIAKGSDQTHRLEDWRERIDAARRSPAGLSALLSILREDSERATVLRDFSPFAGVLTTGERRPFLLECSYAH